MRQTRSTLLAVVAALGLGSHAFGQEADELLEQHFEAVGGRDAIEAVETMRITGHTTMGQGMEAPYTIYWAKPDKIRLEFTLQGQVGVQAYDGEIAWMHMPFMGAAEPQNMPEDQVKEMEQMADMVEGPLFDYQDKGHTVEYLGEEEIEGTPAHKLKVVMESGDESIVYLDAEHFIQIRQENKRTMGDQEVETVTTFGNYKEVGGLLLPFAITTTVKNAPAEASAQEITMDTYEFGVDVSDVQFSMPEVAEAETAEAAAEAAPAAAESAEAAEEASEEASEDATEETEEAPPLHR